MALSLRSFPPPDPRMLVLTGLLLMLGTAGGALAQWLALPMPWMLGSLVSCGILVLVIRPKALEGYGFPMRFRTFFVSLIGVMIGTQVTPELLAIASRLPLTIACLALFVVMAHLGNMILFQRVGGYDRATAYYAGAPGGLMESILMGETAGADPRILTAQQFLRIVLVITLLPLGLSLWTGAPVGSAAGLGGALGNSGAVPPTTLLLIIATGILGLTLGRALRLPAAQLTGPLVLGALATVTGVLDLHLPFWLIASAQVVIGASLGLRFKGMARGLLQRSLGMALLSVSFMLLLGAGFALFLQAATGISFLALLISFAPGGVAEMSIVALSLAASPALVSLHHVMRILMTVVEMPLMAKVLKIGGDPGA